jgi:polyphosphate kinase
MPDCPAALIDRELSWLAFARRVLALVEDREQPLLERVKIAGIMGMIYDEFAMKRIGGLFRQVAKGKCTISSPFVQTSTARARLTVRVFRDWR